MTSTDTQLGRIFTDAASYADPTAWHEAATRIRREQPILRVAVEGFPEFWAITKHADVSEIERHPQVFTNAPIPVLAPAALLAMGTQLTSLIQMDGDEHKAHRHILTDWFKPGSVKRLSGRVDELAAHAIDRMAALGGECDFAQDVAVHFPLAVILSILGLPESEYARMLKLTQEVFGPEDPDLGRDGTGVLQVIGDLIAYFNEVASDRRARPTDDLASVIANATIDGEPLGDLELFGHFVIIATAGHDTTSSAIAGGLLALLQHPDQLELLRRDPALIDHAADEFIRYVSPVKHFCRTCTEPFTLGDVTFEPGDLLLLSYDSANRDDEVFEDPHRLDVTRHNASEHVAFGYGRHFCLGAHLARMEIRAIFRELLGRIDHIELAGEPRFVQARFVSGPKALPVRYSIR